MPLNLKPHSLGFLKLRAPGTNNFYFCSLLWKFISSSSFIALFTHMDIIHLIPHFPSLNCYSVGLRTKSFALTLSIIFERGREIIITLNHTEFTRYFKLHKTETLPLSISNCIFQYAHHSTVFCQPQIVDNCSKYNEMQFIYTRESVAKKQNVYKKLQNQLEYNEQCVSYPSLQNLKFKQTSSWKIKNTRKKIGCDLECNIVDKLTEVMTNKR